MSTATAANATPAAAKPPAAAAYPLTKEIIMQECVRHGFYRTPSCNDKLYLHHKGFDTLTPKCLADYTDAKVIWLEGNCLSSFADDDFSSQHGVLRQLYVHNNVLKSCTFTGRFQRLQSLNMSDNYLEKLQFGLPGREYVASETGLVVSSPSKSGARENSETEQPLVVRDPTEDQRQPVQSTPQELEAFGAVLDAFEAQLRRLEEEVAGEQRQSENKPEGSDAEEDAAAPVPRGLDKTLEMLQLKNNGFMWADSLIELLALRGVNTLDLSGNKLRDGHKVLMILERLPNLRSLYLSGNPCVRGISNYRKTVISRCKNLRHLDDRPVFEDERRLVTAWAEGGMEAEKKEKVKLREEEDAKHRQRLEDFRELIRGGQRERQRENGGNDSDATSDMSSSGSSSDSEDSEEDVTTVRSAQNHGDFYKKNYAGKPKDNGAPAALEEARALDEKPPAADASPSASTSEAGVTPEARSEAPAATHTDPMADMPAATAAVEREAAAPAATSSPSPTKKTAARKQYDKLWDMARQIPDDEDDDAGVWVPGAKKEAPKEE